MEKNAYRETFAVEDQHWWYVTLHDLVMNLAIRFFSVQPLNILDAGCGTGGLLRILSEAGNEVEGFDCSEDALDFCRIRGCTNVFMADINEWMPASQTYDLIVCMDVLYHQWVHDQVKALQNLSKGLRKNGLILLNFPAFPTLSRHHDKVVMVRERYTKNTVKKYLAEADLVPVILSYRLPHAFLGLLILRLFEAITKDQADTKSDIANIPPTIINRFLILTGKLENQLIANGVSIPFGSSLFVAAKKTG